MIFNNIGTAAPRFERTGGFIPLQGICDPVCNGIRTGISLIPVQNSMDIPVGSVLGLCGFMSGPKRNNPGFAKPGVVMSFKSRDFLQRIH